MATLCETERLIIRDWSPQADAEQAFEIYGDPDVTRFIGNDKLQESIETQRQALQRWINRFSNPKKGTGFWAIAQKQTGKVAGTILLGQIPGNEGQPTPDYEVGWHLKKAAWGNGYATEAARAILQYGFKILKLAVIYALIIPENTASIRVAQRLGMTPLGRTNQYYGGIELELFQLSVGVVPV